MLLHVRFIVEFEQYEPPPPAEMAGTTIPEQTTFCVIEFVEDNTMFCEP